MIQWVKRLRQVAREVVKEAKGESMTFRLLPPSPAVSNIIPMDRWTGLHVRVFPPSNGGTATVRVQGAAVPGGWIDLPDPNAVQANVNTPVVFDVSIGTPFAVVRLDAITGGGVWTVEVTPYRSPGQARQVATV